MSNYFESRRHEPYYKYVRSLLGLVSFKAESILDVGSSNADLISWLPCPEKVSIDLKSPLDVPGVVGIKADFLDYDFSRFGTQVRHTGSTHRFDIVTCFQVMEHIGDDRINAFADRLVDVTEHLLVVSVPYMWPKDFCSKWHLQDPVSKEKFIGWFVRSDSRLKPIFSRVIYSNQRFSPEGERVGRLVVMFASKEISEALDSLNEADSWLIDYV